MGCVCGKFSPPSEAQRRNHPVKRVLSRKGSRPRSSNVGERVKRDTQRQRARVSVNKDSGGDVVRGGGQKEKTVAKEEKNMVPEDAAKESKSSKDLDSNESKNEFVDGWPKWLLDNIPTNVLAKLVPKSADSYEKLAKVTYLHKHIYCMHERIHLLLSLHNLFV